jgi:hypothetical protein
MTKISYTITVYNEKTELKQLLDILLPILSIGDELVLVHTYRDETECKLDNFLEIQNIAIKSSIRYYNFHFQNKFADMKNFVNSLATKDYIINFDADEIATPETIRLWQKSINNVNDLYYLPRINTVTGYTLDDLKKYQWNINNNGWINWPDYQPRLFVNNKDIKWVGNVHETIVGYNAAVALPADPRLAIIHHKSIDKQRQQNNLYETINR